MTDKEILKAAIEKVHGIEQPKLTKDKLKEIHAKTLAFYTK